MGAARNVGVEIRGHLLDRFGFADDESYPGRYRRPVDEQHQLWITDRNWGEEVAGGDERAGLEFHVARRDINELRIGLLESSVAIMAPTVRVNRLLFDGDVSLTIVKSRRQDETAVTEFCDTWVGKFIRQAPRLTFIHEMFGVAAGNTNLMRSTETARMLDLMLEGGWSDAAEEEFFPNKMTPKRQANIREWVAEHPNGVDRALRG